jgi:thymidine phosphorylase
MMDVLAVLRLDGDAPHDLRDRGLTLAAAVLELGGAAAKGKGKRLATGLLEDGSAYRKFESICLAQGGFREPQRAPLQHVIISDVSGRVRSIDNREIARMAKFAGAPDSPAAGLRIHVRLGDRVRVGDPLITLHAETAAELSYAEDYTRSVPNAIEIGR